ATIKLWIDQGAKAPSGARVKPKVVVGLPPANVHPVRAIAVSPDKATVVASRGNQVHVYDAKTGRHVRSLAQPGLKTPDGRPVAEVKSGHSDTVFGVCFSPDGKMLATCGADKLVKTWEVPSGKFVKAFEGHTHHVLDVGWKGDGKLLASAGADNVVKVWDFEKGEQVRTIPAHTKQVTRLLFIGKSSQFVTCSGDTQVRFWNADNGGNTR